MAPHITFDQNVPEWMHFLLADAQTAGGLLIACPPEQKEQVVTILEAHDSICTAEIGSISATLPASINVSL